MWGWFRWFLSTALDIHQKWQLFKWEAFLFCVGIIWMVVANSVKWIAQTAAILDALVFPDGNNVIPSGPIAGVLALCNTFFPLSETVGFVIVYYTFAAAWGTYRFIKSWVPTVSGNA